MLLDVISPVLYTVHTLIHQILLTIYEVLHYPFSNEETEALAELGLKLRTPVSSRDHALTTSVHCLSISILQFVKIVIHQDKGECVPWKPCWPHTKKSGHEIHLRYTSPQSWCLIPFFNRRNQGSSEKWLILGLEWGIDKMSLEHLVVAESKDVLKRQNDAGRRGCQRDTGAK